MLIPQELKSSAIINEELNVAAVPLTIHASVPALLCFNG